MSGARVQSVARVRSDAREVHEYKWCTRGARVRSSDGQADGSATTVEEA